MRLTKQSKNTNAKVASRIEIATIFILGFLVIILTVGSLFIFGFYGAYERNDQLKEKTYARGFKIAIISDMLSANHYRYQILSDFFTDENPSFDNLRAKYLAYTDDFYLAVEGLQEMEDSAEQKKLVENIITQARIIDSLYKELSVSKTYTDKAMRVQFKERALNNHKNLDQLIKNLLEFEQINWFRDVADIIGFNETQYKTGTTLFWVVIVTCIFVAIIVLFSARRAEKRLLKQKEYAQATLISIADGVITVNNTGKITQINHTALKLLGIGERKAIGAQLQDVYIAKAPTGGEVLVHPANAPLLLGETQEEGIAVKTKFPSIHYLISKQKVIYEVETSYSLVKDAGKVAGAVIIFRDITQAQEMSRSIKWQAHHDALTGLMNRNSFEDKISSVIEATSGTDKTHALLFMDLDQFKIVNDTCGHIAGDALLAQLGLIFEAQVRKSDSLARLGGDEFGVLLEECNEETAYKIAEKLLAAVSEFRFAWDEKVFSVGVSIGFVMIDKSTQNLSELMSAADMACYAAKDSGRGQVKKYNAEISASAVEMNMSAQISSALDAGNFELYYQPIVSLHEQGKTISEILIRMKTEEELILPNSFLSVAERFGLMKNIDNWVIDCLFSFIKKNDVGADGESDHIYCINVSGASINDDQFFQYVRKKIEEYTIPTSCLCFEITETVAITNLTKAAMLIDKIKALGCTISLDDFGTGASSFAYLKYLPVDYIKIDGTFIRDILDDKIDLEIVNSIVKIASVLNIKTVAEFVENEKILNKVKSLGIDYAQGYGLSHPQALLTLPPVNMNSLSSAARISL